MFYESTRGDSPKVHFSQALNQGLAPDGGLYVPESFPDVREELKAWSKLSYTDLAVEIFDLYCGDLISKAELKTLIPKSLSAFRHKEITPLKQLDHRFALELFHGPTWSFKDVALQSLGMLFERFPPEKGYRTILGATSGDTGSAAIEGARGRDGMKVFILFPEGRVSPIQELQMTTVSDDNIQCLALRGSFDDCQNIVKQLFGDAEFKEKVQLSAVNSINWSRILSQTVYYFYAYFRYLDAVGGSIGDRLSFSVPTGNFGDIFAGVVAKRMGLPVDRLIIATNENDILYRFYETGEYQMQDVVPTESPSMDIQISSNFERLLYLLHGRDSQKIQSLMTSLRESKTFKVSEEVLKDFKTEFGAARVDREECFRTISRMDQECGYILDPHSAIGMAAGEKVLGQGVPYISLMTAHPGKFKAAVEAALERSYTLPEELEALKQLEQKKKVIEASVEAVRLELEQPLS